MAAESKTKHYVNVFLRYFVLILVGLIMIYPLIWMVGATFKSNAEIFSSIGFIPKNPTLEGYKKAMESYGGAINVWKAMLNTFSYVIPKVVFTMISATVTAYGFGRFEFKGRGILFSVLMATLFLPQVVLNVPQFIMFSKMGWVDSKLYLPIIVPTLFATDTLFVFQLIQFLRNVPKELDEAAKIDGCNAVQTLVKVIVPMLSPRFCGKDTVCSHAESIRKKIGQRHDDEHFAQQGEKDGVLLLIQRFEDGLSDVLQIHENKCGKVKL